MKISQTNKNGFLTQVSPFPVIGCRPAGRRFTRQVLVGPWSRALRGFFLSLAAVGICAAAAGFLASPAEAASPSSIGIMYLLKSDAVGNPPHDLATEPCWENQYVQGVALRTQWSKVEPSEGHFDWSYLDQGMALAAQHGKKVSILITAGVTTPDWVFTAGAQKFMVTTQAGPVMPMPLPWDPVFQAKWGSLVQALGARYDSNPQLVYVVMGGPGRRAESYFVFTADNQATFNQLGGLSAWKTGAEWIVDQYAKNFKKTPFLLDLGAPVPTDDGQAALSDVCDYAVSKYPARFGVKSDGLAPDYGPNTYGATEVKKLNPTATVGFQMSLPWKGRKDSNGQLLLTTSLNIGIGDGARFIEVYAGDCDDPGAIKSISNASAQLLGSLPKPPRALRISKQ